MALNQNLVVVGTYNSGADSISADVSGQPTAAGDPPLAARAITLSADYAMIDPPGFPSRPSFTGAAQASLQYPRTLPNGTAFTTVACEAAALVAAGIAAYS
jgi:hypothetical protein